MNKSKRVPVIKFESIVKDFPGVRANDGITLEVEKGEIHSLLGENGAGKTTLMKILYGIYQPDGGRIYLNGERVSIDSPKNAIDRGIGMIHQHFKLVPRHTVAENVVMGNPSASPIDPAKKIADELRRLSEHYGMEFDPQARVGDLAAGERQRVEIVKALYRGAEILILDEPTSVLTPQEAERLFSVLNKMSAEGKTIFFITHKLEEVMALSHRVSVLRKGKLVATVEAEETDRSSLARMMVGREVLFRTEKEEKPPRGEVLRVEELTVADERGLPAVDGVSLRVRGGEILGIAGVSGNGQRELAQALTGMRAVRGGSFAVDGEDLTGLSPREIMERGVAHIPEDRMSTGLVNELNLKDNSILRTYREPPYSRGPLLNGDQVRRHARRLIEEYDIEPSDIHAPAKLLSGGNIQKLVLGRELSLNPRLIVASHPTHGLDVGAAEQIRNLLLRQRANGAGVLLISEDLNELFSISDRIGVLYEGKIVDTVRAEAADREELGLMMAGSGRDGR